MKYGPDQFDQIPRGHYRVIYADPPTKFSAGPNQNPSRHYPTMRLKDIADMPIGDLAHPEGCRLLLWTTPPLLLHKNGPILFLKAWGFKYSTVRTWGKFYPRESGMFVYHDSISRGSGYESSGDAEFLIIAKRGRPQRIDGGKPRGLFMSARREHSRKPDFLRDQICDLFEGPRIELFGRSEHPGFDVFGNEVDKFQEAA